MSDDVAARTRALDHRDHTRRMIKREVERNGFVFVAESVFRPSDLFFLALENGWGFSMENWSKRMAGDHPFITSEPVTCVLTQYVAEVRELKKRVAELEQQSERGSAPSE